MPGYSFSLAVLIRCQPNRLGFAGFFAESVYQMEFGRLKHIVRRITMRKIDAYITLTRALNVTDVTL